MLCIRVLTDYLHLLEDWKVRYAPKTPEDTLDDRFVEACQMHCHIEYMADVLTVGDLEERVALVDKADAGRQDCFSARIRPHERKRR